MGKGTVLLVFIVLCVAFAVWFFLSGESVKRAQKEAQLTQQQHQEKEIQEQAAKREQELRDARKAREAREREAAEKKRMEDALASEKKSREEAESKAKQLEEAIRLAKEAALAAKQTVEASPKETPVQADEKKMVKCPICQGGKLVPCDKCFRTGKVLVGKVCPECGGTKTVCATCRGVGNVVCVPCRGTGKNLNPWGYPEPRRIGPFVYVNCQLCAGTGRVPCPGARCDKRGFIVCDKCRNRGKIPVREPCPDCDGKGRKECARCNGTGEERP
jgi:DnaJ-class molecular chaperone